MDKNKDKNKKSKKGKSKEKKEKKELQLYTPLSITTQIVLDNLAIANEGSYCDKIYFMIEALNVLMADIPNIEKKLKNKFKKDFPNLLKNQYIAQNVKVYYDGLEGNTISKDDISSERFIKFKDGMSALPFINKKVYKMFFYAIKLTKLKDYSISSEAYARAKRKYKTFEPKQEIIAKEDYKEGEEEEEY